MNSTRKDRPEGSSSTPPRRASRAAGPASQGARRTRTTRDDLSFARDPAQHGTDWSEPFARRRVLREDAGDERVARWRDSRGDDDARPASREPAGAIEPARADEAPAERPHEAWSRADQAELWHLQQQRWARGAEGSQRGQGDWSTEGLTPASDVDADAGRHGSSDVVRRTDAQVHEDVMRRLEADDHIDASDVRVQITAGEARVTGTVPDRRSLRMVELAVSDSAGVSEVHSELAVAEREGPIVPPTTAELLRSGPVREGGGDG